MGKLGLFHPYKWSYGPLLKTSRGPPCMYKKNITLFKGKFQPASLLVYQKLKIKDASCWERSERSHNAPQGVGKNTWANFVLLFVMALLTTLIKNTPTRNNGLIRLYQGTMVANNPLINPYFW